MANVIKSEQIYKGRVVNLFLEDVENNGLKFKREVIRHSGGAAILAERDGKFVFVSQYRHPFGEDFFEIPAGTREKGEKGEVTAYRELEEECALKAKNLQFICEYAVSPGYTDETLFLYYANDFEVTSQHLDEDEQLDILWVDKKEVLEKAKKGLIKDGKTLVALLWYLANFKN